MIQYTVYSKLVGHDAHAVIDATIQLQILGKWMYSEEIYGFLIRQCTEFRTHGILKFILKNNGEQFSHVVIPTTTLWLCEILGFSTHMAEHLAIRPSAEIDSGQSGNVAQP